MILRLILSSLIVRGLELPYPQRKVAMVTGYVMSQVCDWLESDVCPAKLRLSLESVGELMNLVKTFLGSKLTVYGVTNHQLDHISSLLLQARWTHVYLIEREREREREREYISCSYVNIFIVVCYLL